MDVRSITIASLLVSALISVSCGTEEKEAELVFAETDFGKTVELKAEKGSPQPHEVINLDHQRETQLLLYSRTRTTMFETQMRQPGQSNRVQFIEDTIFIGIVP